MLKYINDTNEEVKLTLPPKEGEDLPTEITVAAGEEIEIDNAMAQGFLHYELDAKKVEDEQTDNDDGANNVENDTETQGQTETSESEVKENDESDVDKLSVSEPNDEDGKETVAAEAEAKLQEERLKLAEERRILAREKAELRFKKLCETGRAVPAQKDDFMALFLHEGVVTLAEGNTKTVPELLESLMESAAQHSLLEGEQGKDGEGEVTPELTSEDKEVAERFGVTEQELINHVKEKQ